MVFQETFANGLAGVNGNGAWTAEDNQDGSLWIFMDPSGTPSYVSDGTPTGSDHPGGFYSSGTDPLASATAGNGWLIFDNDFHHGGAISETNPAISTEGTLTSPRLDCSELTYVGVSWDSYFRWCCNGASAPVFLEVGVVNDAVTTWTEFDASDNAVQVNTQSPNPLSVSLDVSCAAALEDSVLLRFAWRQVGSSSLQSHYFWGLDDVTVTAINESTDLRLTQIVNGDVYNDFEYRLTPMEQVVDASEGGVLAGLMVQNVGTNNAENVDVLVEIFDETGALLWTVNDSLDVVYSASGGPDCPSQTRDTLYIPTGWEPTETGTYTLRIEVTTDTVADPTPENNVLSKEILFTEDIYGHDNEEAIDYQYWSSQETDASGVPTGLYAPSGFGAFYHCPNEGSTAYGLAVRFGSRCSWNLDDQPDELEFETRLYAVDLTGGGLNASPYESAFWFFEDLGDLVSSEIYLPFDEPIALNADGFFHFAAVTNEYASPGRLSIQGQSASDTDNSTASFRDDFWRQGQSYSPAIRVITSEREAIVMMEEHLAEQGVVLHQNMPNPATDVTAIRFDLAQSHPVVMQVRDGLGRLVTSEDMGVLGAGRHSWDVNLSGWASGLYTYTLQAGNWSTTKKMTVK